MTDFNKKVAKPANSFMLFRSDFMRNSIPSAEQKDQGTVSKLAKEKWDYIKKNKPEEHEYWVHKAKQLSLLHREQNPDYVYKVPGRRVRDSEYSCMAMHIEGHSAPGKASSHSHCGALQHPQPGQPFKHQQYSESSAQAPAASSSTTEPPDDLICDGEELDLDFGSYESIVTMLDFHERGIKTSMSKINDDFFQ